MSLSITSRTSAASTVVALIEKTQSLRLLGAGHQIAHRKPRRVKACSPIKTVMLPAPDGIARMPGLAI